MLKPKSEPSEIIQNSHDKVKTVADYVSIKTGDRVGTALGTIGGATIGTIVAGPVGGIVGSVIGDALGGQLGEDAARELQQKSDSPSDIQNKPKTTLTQWVSNALQDFSGEAATTLVARTIGETIAGPIGAELGETLGTITGKSVQWHELSQDDQESSNKQENNL